MPVMQGGNGDYPLMIDLFILPFTILANTLGVTWELKPP